MENKLEFKVKNRVKIKEEDFKIITPDAYYKLEKYNYNVKQLKCMCKHYNLSLKGNKPYLQSNIYNYLKNYNFATIIQKHYRGYLVRRINKLRGLVTLKKICCNTRDFITLDNIEHISYYQYFSFQHKNKIYGFDITSIYDYIVKRHNTENPYDRTNFSSRIKSDLLKLKRLTIITKQETLYDIIAEKKTVTIRDLFNRIDELGNYTQYDWFENLNYNGLMIFYKELYDIWIYRANLTLHVKYQICNLDPFNNTNPNFFYNYSLDQLKQITISVMEKMLYHAVNDEYQKLGAIYILTALTIASPDAAEAMPWYYSSVI